ncbi:DGQHR domain-containing protein [Serratia quinivorans]|uniref:DGQHR domain-containing protein n=1 Tax=Serratia quinivorans TaxID=137545 RepID=UPI00217847A1|nr:DGQHR domain-containing protein [Serratia quinivorans]CAI1106462.1 DNA phosphorothioation-associated DGQHR protein 1 [Serratia quinivorans]CAI2072020.1 DNA phosphorothioation-associated DGQHR protein 1 [Serratia quinivorans]
MNAPITIYALKVSQPYGDFFQVVLSANLLLECSFINRAEMQDGELSGVQRGGSLSRAREIAKFIDSDEAAFPNSIILSVNYDENDNPVSDEYRWKFIQKNRNLYELVIPDIKRRVCSVIDGQHRLLGFDFSRNRNMELPCAIYDALPPSGQASIFSTINFNQLKVPKSLAYRLFGYSLDDISREYWPPDLLAVYFSEKFNTTVGSPFYNRLKNRVLNEKVELDWSISSSVFIDGVLSLISNNPRLDRYTINSTENIAEKKGRERLRSEKTRDISPLRDLYIKGNDRAIEQVLTMFFNAVKINLWTEKCIENNTILVRTVGISALFQFLRKKLIDISDINMNSLETLCHELVSVDPGEFTNADVYPSTSVGKKKIFDYLINNVVVNK